MGAIDSTKNGKCSKCGSCCSNFIPLTEEEVKQLQELTKQDVEVQIKYLPDNRLVMMCPFLIMSPDNMNDTRCSIYENRPSICRFFKCDKPLRQLTLEEQSKYKVVDMMKDIVHYDYQKEIGLTYEEAMNIHINKCLEDRKKSKDEKIVQ